MAESTKQSANEIPQLVAELANFRTRRQARQRLVSLGPAAVPALLECLKSPSEAVVWCGVRSLRELHARKAVEPLVDLLRRGVLPSEVADALSEITGQDFGTDAEQWQLWLEGKLGEQPEALADPESLIGAVVAGTTTALNRSGDSFRLTVSLPQGQPQDVVVLFGQKSFEGEDVVVVYSHCGPASAELYETVLRRNLVIPYAGFAIDDTEGRSHFVMVETLLRREATPRALRKSIENVAQGAGLVEKLLSLPDASG